MEHYRIQKLMALVLMISAIVLIFIFIRSGNYYDPQIKNGLLVLSENDLNDNQIFKLSGEWEIFWEQYIPPADFVNNRAPSSNVLDYLPSWWNIKDDYKSYPKQGYATYHLLVKVPESLVGKEFGIFTHDTAFNYHLYLDESLLIKRGTLTTDSDLYRPYYENGITFFEIPDTEFHLSIQICMFNDRNGGIARSFLFGESESIREVVHNRFIFDAFLLGMLSFLVLYHLILFSLRPSDHSPFFFGLLCFAFILRAAVQNSKIMLYFFPELDSIFFIRLWISTYYMLIPLFALYFRSLFSKYFNRIVAHSYALFSLIFIIISFTTPLEFFTQILDIYHVVFPFIAAYAVIATILATRAKDIGGDIMSISLAVMLVFTTNDILHNLGIINTGYYVTYGFVLFILAQTYLISLRFSIAFVRNEQLSSELTEANKELTRLDRIKDEFLANTSHELRTPLNGIIGIAESLSADAKYKEDSVITENLSLIVTSGRRLASLVNDLLDFAKIVNDDIQLKTSSLNFYEQVRIVFEHFKYECGYKNIELKNSVDPNYPEVIADEDRIQQVLFNLVGNAVKFTESGIIEAYCENITKDHEKYFALSIKDSGIGIKDEDQLHIFDSFRQADGSITRSYGGTGLGLAISKLIIERHGGHISVESEVNSGSTFTFLLPIKTSQMFNQSDLSPFKLTTPVIDNSEKLLSEMVAFNHNDYRSITPPSDAIQDVTILIVDDDPINVRIISNQFSQTRDNRILEAHNGNEAIKIIEGGTIPDIILLDIMMPNVSGYEVARRVRKKISAI
jgi:two-component system sensor histidine kinase ChiS